MNTEVLAPQVQAETLGASVQQRVTTMIDNLMDQLPSPDLLTSEERRGIIARYSSVLEGNFIYWMTAACLAVHSNEARPILMENLHEEVRDSHPAMLRRFAIAAKAYPTDTDALAVNAELTAIRLFLGKLQGVESLVTMAFFEGFIQKFMAYLATLAKQQGSHEMEYTDVHGVCDIAHSEGLFNAVRLEMALNPISADANLYEGVELLIDLIRRVIRGTQPNLEA
jgi:hypothetical protein